MSTYARGCCITFGQPRRCRTSRTWTASLLLVRRHLYVALRLCEKWLIITGANMLDTDKLGKHYIRGNVVSETPRGAPYEFP